MSLRLNSLIKDWERHCADIKNSTPGTLSESPQEKTKRKKRLLNNYGKFFEYYFPHYCDGGKTKCSQFQIEAAETIANQNNIDFFANWHRGAAKSTHANVGIPLWLMLKGYLHFMLLMGYNETKAKRLLGDIQSELQYNERIIQDYGKLHNYGHWADGEFKTTKGVMFMALSILQDPAGVRNLNWRPDYISFDDFENVKKAKNQSLVKELTNHMLGGFKEAMHKDRKRCVYAQNRKVKNGIFDLLIKEIGTKETTVISEVKPFDEDENPTWPERYSKEYWQKLKANTTWRVWMCEYWLEPVEDGTIFKEEWINWTEMPVETWSKYDLIVGYGDLSYRAQGDFKAIKVWGVIVKEKQFHLLKAFVKQCDLATCAAWLYDFHETLPDYIAVDWFIEGNFIQDDFIDAFDDEGESREPPYFIGINPDKRSKPDKFVRIQKMDAFYARGMVWYNSLEKDSQDMKMAVDQLLAFEKSSGAPDDSPDADEGAFFYLRKRRQAANATGTTGGQKTSAKY